MSSTTSLAEQKHHLKTLLQKLNGLIKKLPTTLPCGSKDGPIAKHFSDYKFGAIEGPCICLAYFEDASKWDSSIVVHAHVLLEHLYDIYQVDGCASNMTAPEVASMVISIFLDDIQNLTPTQQRIAVTKIEAFFSGTYPCLNGDVLKWWKVSFYFTSLLLLLKASASKNM